MAQTQTAPETVTLTREQLESLIAAKTTATAPSAVLSADDLVKAFTKASQKENTQAPMVSVFNPYGDNVKPRPALRCKTLMNGIALDKDTLTWEEIEALNVLPAGEFRVAKSNGQKIAFKVRYVRGMDEDTLERVEIEFPCKDEQRHDHRPLLEYCFEVLESAGKSDEVGRLTNLRRELNAMRKF
jgi:hypothetical protein